MGDRWDPYEEEKGVGGVVEKNEGGEAVGEKGGRREGRVR